MEFTPDREDFIDFTKLYDKRLSTCLDDVVDDLPLLKELKTQRRDSDTSSDSIVWELLAANANKNKFEVSPPNYNAFRQADPHSLERIAIPWSVIEKATHKCQKWLDQHGY